MKSSSYRQAKRWCVFLTNLPIYGYFKHMVWYTGNCWFAN